MSAIFSSSWYRVSALKPRLREHIEIHRHPYGDELAYLLQDHASGKLHRFNASAYDIIGRMNGTRSLETIWQETLEALGDEAPTQDEVIGLLGRLHGIDVLRGGATPDSMELFQRAERDRSRRWKQRIKTPLSTRIPLADPDRLLARLMPYLGPLFSRAGFIIWCIVVGFGLVLAGAHWDALTFAASEQALEPENLLLLAIVYPFAKALHELGHGITTKKWGGEVHEMGVTLMVFMPIPYVDASSSAVIRDKYLRMSVGAAGMMIELLLASLALMLWINIEDGLVRSALFNLMLISGITTVLFNGNPLLKFDAYYILEDAIEVPNLASRSTRYLGYLLQRYVFGSKSAVSPVTRRGERGWLAAYGLLSTPYRWFISIAIIWFVAGEFFVVGVLLAIWAGITQLLLPLGKSLRLVLVDDRLREQRARAVVICVLVVGLVGALVGFYPVPNATQAQGVIWLPPESRLQAGADGFVKKVHVEPLQQVSTGQVIVELDDPFLSARIATMEAEREELIARQRAEATRDASKAAALGDQILSKNAELAREQARAEQMQIRSPTNGRFVPPDLNDPHGRWVTQGAPMGIVIAPEALSVQVAVPQDRMGVLRERIERVDVRLAGRLDTIIGASVKRAVPAAQTTLPSPVLGTSGGGEIPVDPSDKDGTKARSPVFVYELALDHTPASWHMGERVFVRLDHGRQPLLEQWIRWGRQLFLGRFGV